MKPNLLLTSIFLSVLLAQAVIAEDKPRTVSTTGEATVYVTPDECVVTFGIENFHEKLEKARAENNSRADSLLAAIKAQGVEEKYIGTGLLQTEIRYEANKFGAAEGKIAGFVVRRNYVVRLKDLTRLQSLIGSGMDSGANQFHGVEFRSTEMRKHRDEARRLAVVAAKEKATLLAGELGETIGRPLSINESGSNMIALGRANLQNVAMDQSGGGAGEAALPTGQLAISASVAVTFELKN